LEKTENDKGGNMRSVLLKATLGLFIIVGITSMASKANAQSYFELIWADPTDFTCAGVSGGNMTNGTDFILWTCNARANNGYTGAKDQALTIDTSDYIEAGGFFYYSIRDAKNYNKCMGVSGGSTSNNANVMIWDCLGTSHPDQYWLLFPDESTGCNIVYNYHSGMWLGVSQSDYSSLVQTNDQYGYNNGNGGPIEWCPHAVSP
jgi:hypothetical protein